MNPAPRLCTGTENLAGLSRRRALARVGMGLGGLAFANLAAAPAAERGVLGSPHAAPKAKRVIYLFQAGGPSQLETFDYKPLLNQRNGEDLPASVRMGQRLTGMSGNQSTLPLAGSVFPFRRHGKSGAWVCDLFPHTARIVDELCFVRSMYTEAINHDPAITFFQTGAQLAGRPSMGSWLSYGLGTLNRNLPEYVVLVSKTGVDQPLYSRLWGNGFLPSKHQGVQFRAGKDPVLYLGNPAGIAPEARRQLLDAVNGIHAHQNASGLEGDLDARIAQYEMAYRMQTSVPDVMDTAGEPESVLKMYGDDVRKPGSFAANCLLARRLIERDVRFVQLFHQGWDHHGNLPGSIPGKAREVDQASAALVMDLKARGLLEDTLVVWGGEFGRTNYSQGKLTANNYGRDHHPRCFSIWMAGGGVKPGVVHGETDEFGYNVVRDGVHVHDFHATLLHLLGIEHERLTYKFQGRYFRLTDVHGKVVKPILA
jgi:Protein of unknown function (DUF1501)